jgi:hypothetical protein
VEVVIGEESLMHLPPVVVAVVVAVVVTLDEIEIERGIGTSIEMIESLLQEGMNLLHLEVEMKPGAVVAEGVVVVIGVRVRGPVRVAHHREEETVMTDSSTFYPLLLLYDILSFTLFTSSSFP